jgi:hypothetical protein
MDPGTKGYRYYTITDSNSTVVGQVLVPKTTGSIGGDTYNAGTEYWFDVVNLAGGTMPRELTFSWQDYNWSDPGPTIGKLSFTMIENATWSSSSAPSSSSTNFVDNTLEIVIGWQLTLTSATWGGSLVWYNTTGQNNVFDGSAPGSAGLSSFTTPTRSTGWYTATVTPTNV